MTTEDTPITVLDDVPQARRFVSQTPSSSPCVIVPPGVSWQPGVLDVRAAIHQLTSNLLAFACPTNSKCTLVDQFGSTFMICGPSESTLSYTSTSNYTNFHLKAPAAIKTNKEHNTVWYASLVFFPIFPYSLLWDSASERHYSRAICWSYTNTTSLDTLITEEYYGLSYDWRTHDYFLPYAESSITATGSPTNMSASPGPQIAAQSTPTERAAPGVNDSTKASQLRQSPSTATRVGTGIGSACGVLAVIFLIWLGYKHRHKRKRRVESSVIIQSDDIPRTTAPEEEIFSTPVGLQGLDHSIQELQGDVVEQELAGHFANNVPAAQRLTYTITGR